MTQAIPAILGALSNQSRSRRDLDRPTVESAIPAISSADKKRLRKISKEADKERLYNLVTQPEVLGLLITLTGIMASQRMPFSDDPQQNEALKAVATSASVLMGLGYAGVGDLTTMIVALGAGGGSLIGSVLPGSGDLFSSLDPTKWQNWIPGYNLFNR